MAGAPLSPYGVRREERIAMIVRDQIGKFPVAFWGAPQGRGHPVPLNTPAERQRLRGDPGRQPRLDPGRVAALWEVVKPAIDDNRHLRAVSGDRRRRRGNRPRGHRKAGRISSRAPRSSRRSEAHGDELASLALFQRLHRHAQGGAACACLAQGEGGGGRRTRSSGQVLGICQDGFLWCFRSPRCSSPYGLGNAMSFPMSVGATTVIFGGRPTPDAVFGHHWRGTGPTIFCGVPTLFRRAGRPKQEKRGRRARSRHPAVLPRRRGAARARSAGALGKGSGDARSSTGGRQHRDAAYLSVQPPGRHRLRPARAGRCRATKRLAPGGNEHDEEVAEGEVGELLSPRPVQRRGYWNRRHKSMSDLRRPLDPHPATSMNATGRAAMSNCGRPNDMFQGLGHLGCPFPRWNRPWSNSGGAGGRPVGRAGPMRGPWSSPHAFIVVKDGMPCPPNRRLRDIGQGQDRDVEISPLDHRGRGSAPRTRDRQDQRFKLRRPA